MGRCSRELPPAQGGPRGSPPKGGAGNKPVVLEGAAAGVGVVVFGPRASRRTVGRGTRMCRGSVDTAEPSSFPPRDRDRQGQSWTGRRGAVDGKGIPGWQQRDFSRGSPQRPRLTGSTRDLLSLRRAVRFAGRRRRTSSSSTMGIFREPAQRRSVRGTLERGLEEDNAFRTLSGPPKPARGVNPTLPGRRREVVVTE
jgi:hypothetical protein